MTDSLAKLSFVIPAFREAANIGRTIASIREHVPPDDLAEIIVCDHGSDDDTVAIAREAGAIVEVWHDGTIARQRNRGAALATGDILVFLDADTSLTPEWADALPAMRARLGRDERTVTGSHPQPPPGPNWLHRHWFANLAGDEGARHLGSAHLVMTRRQFEAIGGFDAELETGEDFEICLRAVAHGSHIVIDERLRAIHHDFPRTLAAFVRREAWHGRGNFASWQMLRSSPVGAASALFLGMHLAVPLALVTRPRLALLPLAGIAGLCVASSAHKFRRAPLASRVVNAGIFYFYYSGRALALVRALRRQS